VIDAPAHALVAALARDDLDAALDMGLLDSAGCPSCSAGCTRALLAARDERRGALAARERFLARQARLARRAAEKVAARAAPSSVPGKPALPAGAADALARAMARARGSRM
jgi:hypothetical protein